MKGLRWYLAGYGDEASLRREIAAHGMEEHVVILGKKANPYPYMAACGLYVQPSRYEGKAVAVREAQILGRPVAIRRFPTASGHLEDGVDLAAACRARDYGNRDEILKLEALV